MEAKDFALMSEKRIAKGIRRAAITTYHAFEIGDLASSLE